MRGRCRWCGIAQTWWERLIRFFYLGHCGECRRALDRDDPSPPFRYQSRRTVCRKYLFDHDDYCPGHHAEMYR